MENTFNISPADQKSKAALNLRINSLQQWLAACLRVLMMHLQYCLQSQTFQTTGLTVTKLGVATVIEITGEYKVDGLLLEAVVVDRKQ